MLGIVLLRVVSFFIFWRLKGLFVIDDVFTFSPYDYLSGNEKMAHLMELPNEILHAIMIALVLSYDGAKDLTRASAT